MKLFAYTCVYTVYIYIYIYIIYIYVIGEYKGIIHFIVKIYRSINGYFEV